MRACGKDIKTKRIKATNIIDTVSSKVQNKFTNEEIETRHYPHGVYQSARCTPAHARFLPNAYKSHYEDVRRGTLRLSSISEEVGTLERGMVVPPYAAVFPPSSVSPASARWQDWEKGHPNQGMRTVFGKSLLPSH